VRHQRGIGKRRVRKSDTHERKSDTHERKFNCLAKASKVRKVYLLISHSIYCIAKTVKFLLTILMS